MIKSIHTLHDLVDNMLHAAGRTEFSKLTQADLQLCDMARELDRLVEAQATEAEEMAARFQQYANDLVDLGCSAHASPLSSETLSEMAQRRASIATLRQWFGISFSNIFEKSVAIALKEDAQGQSFGPTMKVDPAKVSARR